MHCCRLSAAGFLCLLACLSVWKTADGSHQTESDEATAAAPAADARARRDQQIVRLQPLSVLIGEWRGVGQPQRGSRVGAWIEKTRGVWDFADDHAAITLISEDSPRYTSARFATNDDATRLQLTLSSVDDSQIVLSSELPATASATAESPPTANTDPDVLVFSSDELEAAATRCTLRKISDIRVTLLVEQRSSIHAPFRRICEIGYTRAGERLARSNSGERLCIVTGGLGTISVMFEGKTWYVCCEGCRQAFEDDPQGTIDAYKARLAAEAD